MSSSIRSDALLCILSIDGGGVRGISSLYILKEIMAQVRRQYRVDRSNDPNEKFRPCDLLDLICGTSTRGLIALMLRRLKLIRITIAGSFRSVKSLTLGRMSATQ
jgi:patatin-like phospholipase/acyl hydrolase